MKKGLNVAVALLMVSTLLAGCGSDAKEETQSKEPSVKQEEAKAPKESEPAKEKVELTFMTNVVGEKATALETAVKGFETETGYTVEFSAPGDSYEELMKTKMSANELPDVFTTHGWSVARYSEYLAPINDLDFASRISDQIKPVITNADGEMFVLPIDIDIAGMVYNQDVLAAAEVAVEDLKTWADFEEACDKIKESGVEPMHIGGKDSWTIGQFFDWVAPSFYVTDEANSKAAELKAGTFDSAIWTEISQMMADWTEAGYFNVDVLTADYMSDIDALATGQTAFCFYGNSSIMDAENVNAEANLGMMPIPANVEGDEPSLIAGESIAIGAWKDSPNLVAAQELLSYLARPEIASEIAKTAGNSSGLNDVDVELGDIKVYYDKYKSVETFPYFDREYLPGGMWDVMCATGAEILAQNADAVENAAKVMEQNFNDKFVQ